MIADLESRGDAQPGGVFSVGITAMSTMHLDSPATRVEPSMLDGRGSREENWLSDLTPEATLNDLPSFDATASPEMQTAVLDQQFHAHPELPGVIIASSGRLWGLVSREVLLGHLSRPFGIELYLKRPIRLLLESEQQQPLVLPADCPVGEAAQQALTRPSERVYEPIIMRDAVQFRLMDVHTLLIAQSQLLKLANETIQKQMISAEAANRAKSQFLANMSHEIRTPLTAILGFTENLLEPHMPEVERTSALQTILRNGHHLLQLINDILDLSKIEAGRLETERLSFSPGELAADVVSALRVRADAKSIQLRLAYRGSIPDAICSDPTRLRQILINLVGNAIKFTEKGAVEVRVSMRDVDPDRSRLLFEIVDSGIGMTAEQMERLFQPFTQADGSMARRFGGTGLGLSISRQLAQLLGGDILVTSEVDRGSTFAVSVETGPLEGIAWRATPPAGFESRPSETASVVRLTGRLLLAEDGPDNQVLIGSFLKRCGAEVTIVNNGQKAVAAAKASLAQGTPFDLILMDMQMPVLDGYAATRELRAGGWLRPILALTANAMSEDRQKCLAAGCDDFATKPIDRRRLIAQIQEMLSSPTGSEELAEPTANEPSVPTADVLDWQLASNRVGGDSELLREIAEMLIEVMPGWLAELERLTVEGDLAGMRRIAHSLKNSADNFGGRRAVAAAARVEAAAAIEDFETAQVLIPDCRDEVQRLLVALRQFLDKEMSVSCRG